MEAGAAHTLVKVLVTVIVDITDWDELTLLSVEGNALECLGRCGRGNGCGKWRNDARASTYDARGEV